MLDEWELHSYTIIPFFPLSPEYITYCNSLVAFRSTMFDMSIISPLIIGIPRLGGALKL